MIPNVSNYYSLKNLTISTNSIKLSFFQCRDGSVIKLTKADCERLRDKFLKMDDEAEKKKSIKKANEPKKPKTPKKKSESSKKKTELRYVVFSFLLNTTNK